MLILKDFTELLHRGMVQRHPYEYSEKCNLMDQIRPSMSDAAGMHTGKEAHQ